MTLAKDITVRYRADGHVRFQLPPALCGTDECKTIGDALRQHAGISRVDLYPRQRKLSIRYIESTCSYPAVLQALRDVAEAKLASTAEPSCCSTAASGHGTHDAGSATGTHRDRHEAGTALELASRQAPARPHMLGPIKESTVIEFFNDVLVLFLIKLHWHMITQHWLRQPWRYRYEWMAAIYLIYLLVRSRRPKG